MILKIGSQHVIVCMIMDRDGCMRTAVVASMIQYLDPVYVPGSVSKVRDLEVGVNK